MAVVEGDDTVPVIWDEYKKIIADKISADIKIETIERSAFYERGKAAYAIVASGEEAIYANILLKKGVVK
jgi:L-fucose mutarotase